MNKPVILCVDDETIIVDALKEQLNRKFGSDYAIETSESGEDALEVFREIMHEGHNIPVVIADYLMPGLKGDALLTEIHKLSPLTHNILLTGQANIEGVANAVNYANLYRYITKPWDLDDLELTIREAIKLFDLETRIIMQNTELAELNASLEKKVRQRTMELQDLNATKDKFFSIIAHDLKNPFNALVGFSKYLVENFDVTSDEDKRQFLIAMKDAADHGYKLLENLLEWSRSQTGKINWQPEEVFVSSLISETIDILSKAAENKNLAVISTVPDSLRAFADENMVKTVLRNLISNAIKYSYENSEILIGYKSGVDEIELFVKDHGTGIGKNDKSKLFKIDSSFSTKGTSNEEGTGLGLILCKEFIEKNGGRIWVESVNGKGSVFSFTLPAVSDKAISEKAASKTRQ